MEKFQLNAQINAIRQKDRGIKVMGGYIDHLSMYYIINKDNTAATFIPEYDLFINPAIIHELKMPFTIPENEFETMIIMKKYGKTVLQKLYGKCGSEYKDIYYDSKLTKDIKDLDEYSFRCSHERSPIWLVDENETPMMMIMPIYLKEDDTNGYN